MRFEFATSDRIVFGPGSFSQVGQAAASFGSKAFVVTGRDTSRAYPLLDMLKESGVDSEAFSVRGEPTVETIDTGIRIARAAGCDMVVGFGGGSAIDTVKAVSALLTNKGALLDYLEVIGRGQQLERPAAPMIAVPTTSGTGAEVTRNAVIGSPEHRVKVSLRSRYMIPSLAVVDPELTAGLPPEVTASTGMDALSQLVEPFVTRMPNPIVDGFCREGMRLVARSLRRAFDRGDESSREEMSMASLLGGLALANAGLGAVHGIAGPLGGMFFGAPHGAVCGRLLAPVMRVNLKALERRDPKNLAIDRYGEVARVLSGKENATAEDGARWIEDMSDFFQIPPLSSYGLSEQDYPDLVERSRRASSMKRNPVELTSKELTEILVSAG